MVAFKVAKWTPGRTVRISHLVRRPDRNGDLNVAKVAKSFRPSAVTSAGMPTAALTQASTPDMPSCRIMNGYNVSEPELNLKRCVECGASSGILNHAVALSSHSCLVR
nr:hypothetical protein CFP56_70638 [Quercus suber]